MDTSTERSTGPYQSPSAKFDGLSEQTLTILRVRHSHLFGVVPASGFKRQGARKRKTRYRDLARLGHDITALFADDHQRALIRSSWRHCLSQGLEAGDIEQELAELLEEEFARFVLGNARWRPRWRALDNGDVEWAKTGCPPGSHRVSRLLCARCAKDRRGELGLIGRFRCDSHERLAVWIWRDARLGRGPLVRASSPWPDLHLAPKCRKCHGTPKLQLRTLVAKLNDPELGSASEIWLEPGGRFVPATSTLLLPWWVRLSPARFDRQTDRQPAVLQ